MAKYRFVLDEFMPVGEVKIETVVMCHPDTELSTVIERLHDVSIHLEDSEDGDEE